MMAFYKGLKDYPRKKQQWIARQLLALREDLGDKITAGRDPDSLIIATWNIRAFDGGMPRLDDSYHYLAEIISAFDICAIQEIKTDLGPLRRLKNLLGPNWDYFVNDASDNTGGNHERMAFLYNTDKVFFRSLVGELVTDEPLARAPFFAAFQAGWFRFTLVSSHVVFGKAGQEARRAKEITAISDAIARRARNEDQVYVFLGDMNIEKQNGPAMKALRDGGLDLPPFGPTNMAGDAFFDQIAFHDTGGATRKTRLLRHGEFDWRDSVFPHPGRPMVRPQGGQAAIQAVEHVLAHYEPIVQKWRSKHGEAPYKDFARSYKGWTTHEMSDHLPIWVELETDYSDDYLAKLT